MNEDQVKGKAKQVKGDVKEGVGGAVDDKSTKNEGKMDQAPRGPT